MPSPISSTSLKCNGQNHFPENKFYSKRLETLQWLFQNGYSFNGTLVAAKYIIHKLYEDIISDNSDSQVIEECLKLVKLVPKLNIYSLIQSLMKMHPLLDEYILKLLQQDEYAIVLVSRNMKQSMWQTAWQNRLQQTARRLFPVLSSLQIHTLLQRIMFLNGLKHADYSALICSVDMVIDSFPFGGGVTMCDAIGGACYEEINKKRYSIPFITSGYLQSVHRIGQGIHQHIMAGNGALEESVAITGQQDILIHQQVVQERLSNRNGSVAEFMISYYERHVELYVRETVQFMQKRKHQKADMQHQVDSVIHAIYDDLSALNEWKDFVLRIVS